MSVLTVEKNFILSLYLCLLCYTTLFLIKKCFFKAETNDLNKPILVDLLYFYYCTIQEIIAARINSETGQFNPSSLLANIRKRGVNVKQKERDRESESRQNICAKRPFLLLRISFVLSGFSKKPV